MERVVKTLNLELNEDTTFCIAIGSKKQITQVTRVQKNQIWLLSKKFQIKAAPKDGEFDTEI